MSFFIRNLTDTDIEINDLGLTVEVGIDLDLRSEPFNAIATSTDIRSFITAGDIVVLDPADGSTQLSTVDSLRVVDVTNSAPYGTGIGVGSKLDQIEDVNVPNPVNDYVLTYDSPNNDWRAKPSQDGGGPGGDSTSVREAVIQIAHGFSTGDAVYHDGTVWQLAQADSVNTLATGVVEVTGNDNFDFVSDGDISTMTGLTPGNWYYVSDTIPGGITDIEPSLFSNPVGYAEAVTKLHVVSIRAQDLSGIGGDPGGGVSKKLVVQTAHGYLTGQPIYLDNAGLYQLAQADDIVTLGTSIIEIVDVNSFYVVDAGDVEGMSGLVTGEWYYVDEFSAGQLTTTEPSIFSNPMGYADNTTRLHVVFARATDLTAGTNPSSDKKIITQNSHGFTTGQPIYFDGAIWQLAQANSVNTLATEVVIFIDVNTFEAVALGSIDGLINLTPGSWYFVDEGSAGILVTTEPTISNPIGIAESTSKLFVIPMRAVDYTNA